MRASSFSGKKTHCGASIGTFVTPFASVGAMASFSVFGPAFGIVRGFFSFFSTLGLAAALRFLDAGFAVSLPPADPVAVSAFFSFFLAGVFFFFSGFGGSGIFLPAAISLCSCSYAAAASSPSFWACRVASSPYKMRCAHAAIEEGNQLVRNLQRACTSSAMKTLDTYRRSQPRPIRNRTCRGSDSFP